MKKLLVLLAFMFLPSLASAQTHTFCATDTNCTWTGTETFANLNGVVYIGGSTPQIGASSDIGAQINAAYAAAPSYGQKAILLPLTGGGCYNYSTPIVLNTSGKYFPIEGAYTGNQTGGVNQGVCLNYTPTTATTAFTIDYTPATGGGFVGNPALKNIILSNNSCISVGGCGSSATGLVLGSANGAHFAVLENVRVSGFSTGITINVSNGWGILFNQVSVVFNATGVTPVTIMENIRWHGGTLSENSTGLSCANSSGFTFESVSFDTNSTLAVNNAGCNITFVAPWFENSGNANAQYITQSTGQFSISGGQMLDDNNSGTVAQHITTTGGFFDIRGLMVFSGGQTVTNLVNNSGGGIGGVDWFAVSPTLDAPVASSTCATAYNCTVKRFSGATPQTTFPVVAIPFAGAGDPSCTGLGGVMNLLWNKASTNRFTMCNNGAAADPVVGGATVDTFSGAKSFNAGTLLPSAAGGTDIGSTSLPFGNLWLGTAATNNFKFQPAATAAARTISIPDPLGNTSLPLTIASGTKALNTAAITTATCDAGAAVTATGTLSTDTVDWSFNAAPTATNKYGAFLVVYAVPSANTVTFYTCNPSATTSTPTAMTVNWSVRRP